MLRSRLRWSGHLVRLDDSRIQKQIFYGEFTSGKKPPKKQKKRYKDSLKENLKKVEIPADDWETLACNRSEWKVLINQKVKYFDERRVSHCQLKRSVRMRDNTALETLDISSKPHFICPIL